MCVYIYIVCFFYRRGFFPEGLLRGDTIYIGVFPVWGIFLFAYTGEGQRKLIFLIIK